MLSSVKSAALTQNHPALGWLPEHTLLKTHAGNWCSKSVQGKGNFPSVSFYCLYVYSQHPAPRFMLQSQWAPEATLPVPLTAQPETESGKGSMKVTFLHWKTPAGFVELLKQNPHKLQVFSEAEQLKPRGWFLGCLGRSDLPKSSHQLLSCLVPWHSLLSGLNNFPTPLLLQSMKNKKTKFKTKEAAFEITNDRNYCPKENMTKTNSENCIYHKFAPCFPTTSIMLRLISTNLSISNAWEWGRCKAGLYLCQVFDSCIMLQIAYEKCSAKL